MFKQSLKKTVLIALSSCLFLFPMAACDQAESALQTDSTSQDAAVAVSEQFPVSEEAEQKAADAGSSRPKQKPSDSESREKPAKKEGSTNASPGSRSKSSKSGSSSESRKGTDSSAKSDSQKASGKKSSSQKSGKKADSSASGSAVKSLSDGETVSGGTYTAEKSDESAIDASGSVTAAVTGSAIQKTAGDASSADASSFQGVNAAVRVYDSATVTLNECVIESDASNATGVFAYDKGTVYLNDTTVTVTGGGSGGVQVAGGGTLYGTNLTVTSASKAAIRSDRGSGTMVLDGGSYTATGSNGCPAIYSTADITVSNAECVSTNSRAVIIEGKNSVTLENCVLSGNDQSTKTGSIKANVLLYQSASGDAAEGTSVFTMRGGSMTSLSGAMFYCTNTSSVIDLYDADLILSEDDSLLIVSAGRWGKDGKNGGICTLNAVDQTLSGTITVDAISSLSLHLSGSVYTGCIQSTGSVDVHLTEGSIWKLTGDSYVTAIDGDLSGLELNGFTLYVNGAAYTA